MGWEKQDGGWRAVTQPGAMVKGKRGTTILPLSVEKPMKTRKK